MKVNLRYVRDRAAAAHIWDHVNDRRDHALCGHEYQDPVELKEGSRPRSVCRGCQSLIPAAEAVLWRQVAEESTKLLKQSERDYRRLATEYETLWSEYDSYTTDYEAVRTDYETLVDDYKSLGIHYEELWTEYESLWTTYEQLAVHSDNQRRTLAQLQTARAPHGGHRNQPTPPPMSRTMGASSPPKKAKKKSSGKINPGRRVPSGRRRVKFRS